MSRITFTVNRAAEFFSEKELEMQMGAGRSHWLPMLVKELIDNALDACEGGDGVTTPEITIALGENSFAIADNGPGIPSETVKKSLDYMSRTSSNNLYVAPTRGQLGNALKCLYAAGYVVHGQGKVVITARGIQHRITVGFDSIRNEPVLGYDTTAVADEHGTTVEVAWRSAWALLRHPCNGPDIEDLIDRYQFCNPHVRFSLTWPRIKPGPLVLEPTRADFSKWKPSSLQPAHWLYTTQFQQLLCAFIASQPEMLVRDFIRQFQGMTNTNHQKTILETLGLQRITISAAFTANGDPLEDRICSLHEAITACSGVVRAARLGPIGGEIGLEQLPAAIPETLAYKKVVIEDQTRPFIAEAWFIAYSSPEGPRQVLIGLNHSPVLNFSSSFVYDCLDENEAARDDPITVILHLACPAFEFTDRGKSRIQLSVEQEDAITKALNSVLAKWKKEKRKLARDQKADRRFMDKLAAEAKPKRMTLKDAAYSVMERAYMKASGNGSLPARARQIMYAARPLVQALTGGRLWKDDQTFTQTYLPDFQAEYPDLTANWNVVYDDRGNLIEPHTDRVIPIGTLAVRRYVDSWTEPLVGEATASVPVSIRTSGPTGRFQVALFVEKEGFTELFKAAGTTRRYDIAIFSTKGMSTTASRELVDQLSSKGVRVFLLHDLDNAGMTIAGTLQADGRRYKFKDKPSVLDLGMRLEQVDEMGLESEEFEFPRNQNTDPRENLRRQGATEAECNFLVRGRRNGRWWGQRVELNAMSSPQFVEFVHSQLEAHGVEKVMPDEKTLAAAYQHVLQRDALLREIKRWHAEKLAASSNGGGEILAIPDDLADRVRDRIEGTPADWIDAIQEIAREDDAA
jgi:DNA topoisomerase VI subunit B